MHTFNIQGALRSASLHIRVFCWTMGRSFALLVGLVDVVP